MHVVPGAFSEGGGGLEPTRGGQAPACVTISGTQWGLSSRTRHRPASMGSNRRGSQIGGCCVCGGSAWRRPASRAGMHHFPVLPLQVVLTPLFNFQPESPVRKESSGLALRTRGQVWDDGGSAPPGGLGEGGVIAASQRPLLAALGSKMGWGGTAQGCRGQASSISPPGHAGIHGRSMGQLQGAWLTQIHAGPRESGEPSSVPMGGRGTGGRKPWWLPGASMCTHLLCLQTTHLSIPPSWL